jgi:hypothetical protein
VAASDVSLAVHLLDTGHFPLETHAEEIGQLMLRFLDKAVTDA